MAKQLNFQAFWTFATARSQQGNDLHYHGCCDSWSTRNCKKARNSHNQHLQWRKLISALEPNSEGKEKALLAKMTEEGWKIPVVLNELCGTKTRQTFESQLPFKLENSCHPQGNQQTSLALPNFSYPNNDQPQNDTPSGR
jgi:hypothetical protein